MDTAALAAAFPFTSPDLPRDPAAPDPLPGVLYGANTAGPGLVAWDRWAQDNHNSVTLAASGAGQVLPGQAGDPPQRSTRAPSAGSSTPKTSTPASPPRVGGAYVHLGAPGCTSTRSTCPPPAPGRGPDALTRRALFLHTVIAVLLGGQPAPGGAGRAGPGDHGRLPPGRDHRRPPHLGPARPAAARTWPPRCAPTAPRPPSTLADRLVPVHRGHPLGAVRRADHHPPRRAPGRLLACATCPTSCSPAATLLALDAIWRQVSDPADRRRRLIIVDEAWLLMRDPEGARFLFRMAKAARKHWAGLAVVTQDAEDVLGTDLGRAVIANAATQILLRQAPQAIEPGRRRVPPVRRGAAAAAVRPPGRGPAGRRAVRPGVVPGPGLARRALPVHQRPGRDRPHRRPARQPAGRRPGPAPARRRPDAEDDLLP